MKCVHIQDLLSNYFDGTLEKNQEKMVERHIQDCMVCEEAFEKEKEIHGILVSMPEIPCPEDVVRRIEKVTFSHRETTRTRRKSAFSLNLSWKPLVVGAAAMAICILVLMKFPKSQEPFRAEYSREEVLDARKQAKWSLAYVAKLMSKTERQLIETVLTKELPSTVRESVQKALPIYKGGEQ
jgi:hypothetical protein